MSYDLLIKIHININCMYIYKKYKLIDIVYYITYVNKNTYWLIHNNFYSRI
jgi:hypothetical protein